MDIIRALDKIVTRSGEGMEGNICYQHLHKPGTWDPAYQLKRQHWAELASAVDWVIEVGINAGHSAALALGSTPTVCYLGMDPAEHRYTQPCCEFLAKQYPGRFHWQQGRSQQLWPKLTRPPGRVLWSIDGEHSLAAASEDLAQAQQHCQPGDWLWFDDADSAGIAAAAAVVDLERFQEHSRDPRWRVWQCRC